MIQRSILVIGYGNLLRSDDGVGQRIANEIAARKMPNVEAIAVHQLTPELATQLTRADIVFFVDAYATAANQEVQICPLELAESGMTTGHWCGPQVLLAMTQALYGHHPQSWWVMVPGINFELGDSLSPIATQGIETALHHIDHLIIDHLIKTARIEPCMKLG